MPIRMDFAFVHSAMPSSGPYDTSIQKTPDRRDFTTLALRKDVCANLRACRHGARVARTYRVRAAEMISPLDARVKENVTPAEATRFLQATRRHLKRSRAVRLLGFDRDHSKRSGASPQAAGTSESAVLDFPASVRPTSALSVSDVNGFGSSGPGRSS